MRVLRVLLLALLAAPAAQADVFGLLSCGSDPACPGANLPSRLPTTLVSFPESGGVVTSIGFVRVGGVDLDADGLALSPTLGLYGFELEGSASPPVAGSQLLSIDETTGAATRIGASLGGREIRGAFFDGADRLWALDAANDEYLEIDPATGATIGTPIALTLSASSYDVSNASDIAIDANGEILLGDLLVAYRLDPTTGALTALYTESVVGTDGILPVFTGVAYDTTGASGLFSCDVNGTDDIFVYDDAFVRTERHLDISSINAGRCDLAAVPPTHSVPTLGPAALLLLCFAVAGAGARVVGEDRTQSSRPGPAD